LDTRDNRKARLNVHRDSARSFLFVTIALGFPAVAVAGGFEYGPQGVHAVGRGGAFVVGADDPSAMYWNPARLALLRGTRVQFSQNITFLDENFQRLPAALRTVNDDNTLGAVNLSKPCEPGNISCRFDPVSAEDRVFPVGISGFVTTDFGLEDWAFGLGMVGPAAYGRTTFPSTPASASRYAVESYDVMLAYVTASAAWKYKDVFGIGASLQYAFMPSLKYSLSVITPGSIPGSPKSNLTDLRVSLDMHQYFGMTAILGLWYRPLPCLELAASSRFVPLMMNTEGDVTMTGTPNSVNKNMAPVTVPGTLEFTFPATVQAGIRYVHPNADDEVFDIEADFAWENWAAMDAFRLSFGADRVDTSGASIKLRSLDLVRNYQDTWRVSLGGQYNVLPKRLSLRLGGWWESGAQPNAYTMLDFPAWDRFGVAGGISGEWRGIEIAVSYAHIFLLPRDVAEGEGRIYQQWMQENGTVLNLYPVNEGHYDGAYDVVTVGLTIHWDTLVHGESVEER
jgi:long-chain fatty acid transport protein